MKESFKKLFPFFFGGGKWKPGKEDRFRNFVALGDSIVSDDYPGPDSGAASLLHLNKNERFPAFQGLDLREKNPRLQFHNLTKTGWMLPDLLSKVETLKGSSEPTLIMVSAGGNDLLHAYAEMKPIEPALDNVQKQMEELKAKLKHLYPNQVIRILNTYDPTDGTGLFQSGRHVPEGPEALAALNSMLRDVAGSDLVDIHRHFLGHGIRHADPQFHHHDPDDPSGWFKMDIEPNPRGAHEVRRKVWESIQ